MPKFIIVTGGVLSGLGKGIASASIGLLLKGNRKVVPIKCDGYLNTDPGTMNPIEHGEVFVLEDGGEVDMDFGHYERYINEPCKFEWNLTMGKVFQKIWEKERKGEYLGKTVQFIPHVTDLVQDWIIDVSNKEDADIVLIEIGGTIGDIENELYLEACRRLKKKVGPENILYVHLTYVPIPAGVNEQKSKPTQQSVNILREKGIQPDVIIARCSEMLDENIKEKISTFTDVPKEAVITGIDVDSVYKIPLVFDNQGLGEIISKRLGLKLNKERVENWKRLLENERKHTVKVAICGKYTKLEDSYASVIEALVHAGANLNSNIEIAWIETTDENKVISSLTDVDAVIVPGGFGGRGTEGKIEAVRYCRENNVPYLGICLGLQMALIEHARNCCSLTNANSKEYDKNTLHPVVDILPEQKKLFESGGGYGGTMRLGAYDAFVKRDSKIGRLYNKEIVSERHRHRYEINPDYHEILENHGLIFSGMSPDGVLVEFIERTDHPYFVATQAHPELKSTLDKPAPMFYGLIEAAIKLKNKDFDKKEELPLSFE